MNKLKTVINSLRYAFLLLLFILTSVTVNGQVSGQKNTVTQDSIQSVNKALDTIPVNEKRADSIKKPDRVLPSDSINGSIGLDTINPVGQTLDTIIEKKSDPIVLI